MENKTTTGQVKGPGKLKNGNPINVSAQFGQPNGNRRNPGGWKKEDTLRYKWERILRMDEDELKEVLKNPKIGRVEQMTAEVLLDRTMKATEKIAVLDRLATQVYGQPKVVQENHNIEVKPLVDLTKRGKNGQDNKPE